MDPLGLNPCPGGDNTPACERPNELIPPEVSRNGAFKQAKLEAGIPRTQHPDSVYDPRTGKISQIKYVNMTDRSNENVLNAYGKPILTREYQFTREDGLKIIIQDHSAGHKFSAPGNEGDQKPHLNLRPISNPRTGKIPGAKNHFYFKERK